MLNLDFATVIFQALNFIVLTFLLYRFLFQPFLRRVNERAEEKARLMRELAEELEKAAQARAELERRLARAHEEAEAIINSAQERVEAARKALVEEAYKEAERILTEAQEDRRRLREQALSDSYEDILNTIIDLSGVAIQQIAPPELHEALVSRLVESVWELGRTDIERVEDFRRSLGERTPTVSITSARPLTVEQQGVLARTLSAFADRQLNLEVQTDPRLVAGIRVRIADMVIDSSVAGDLDGLREEIGKTLKARLMYD